MHSEWVTGADKELMSSGVSCGEEGNPLMDQNGKPQLKIPNPRVELPYMYLMAWYAMHCPSMITTVPASEGFMPVQRLEDSNWIHYYMFFYPKNYFE